MKNANFWYFDPISPFAYLQLCRLRELQGVDLQPRPVLFAGLLKHHGQLGPAEIPSKRRFTYRYVIWAARRQGLRLRFPPAHPFNPLPPLRLCIALGCTWPVVRRMFEFLWHDGQDPAADWPVLCASLGTDPEAAAEMCSRDEVKQALRRNTEDAIAQGVFGVPTLTLGGELFWGQDATEMAKDYLADPERFADPAMEAVDGIPEAVIRRR